MPTDFHPIIKEIGFDFWWNTQKLWNLTVPIEEMEISELEWYFDLPVWEHDKKEFSLTPNEVLSNRDKYTEQYERTLRADTSFPVEVMYLKNRWCVMDGIHRVVKLKLLGYQTVKVKKITRDHIPLIEDTFE